MRLLAALCALLLGACASFAPPAPVPQLGAVPAAFEVSARISIRQADRSDIAKLRWTHRPASDAWAIASPIGNEIAAIRSDASGAVLRRAGADDERAATFAALTERLLGAALEPQALAAWLHGTKPGDTAADWKVTVDETQQAGSVQLARRITATRADTVVKLVVDSYRPLED